ncbi:MAG: VWA domain-containing protein [Acidobacteriota bacterium]
MANKTAGRLIRQDRRRAGRNSAFGIAALAVAVLLPLAAAYSRQSAQKPDPQKSKEQEQFKIGVEVNMVTVPVTVRRPGGGFVKSLPQEAFRITEDGEAQEIVMFAQEGVPTRLAIVLDISGSVRTEWGTIKYATRRFLENLRPEDRFSLVTFNTETRLKIDWGSETDRLDAVLGSIYCKDNTNLWDAVWVVANEVFPGIREKKAVIIMSDGLDTGSMVSYGEALESVVRAEAAVYVVSKTQAVRDSILHSKAKAGFYDGVPEQIFFQADLALRKLAYETGGRVLYPSSFGQLGNVYAEVDEELRNQYTIGYVSTNTKKDGSYRRIEVLLREPDVVLSARPGYYAPREVATGLPDPHIP